MRCFFVPCLKNLRLMEKDALQHGNTPFAQVLGVYQKKKCYALLSPGGFYCEIVSSLCSINSSGVFSEGISTESCGSVDTQPVASLAAPAAVCTLESSYSIAGKISVVLTVRMKKTPQPTTRTSMTAIEMTSATALRSSFGRSRKLSIVFCSTTQTVYSRQSIVNSKQSPNLCICSICRSSIFYP